MIAHIITGLNMGGAEITLVETVLTLKTKGVHSFVLCLNEEGNLAKELRINNIEVVSLGLSKPRNWLRGLASTWRTFSKNRPTLIHTWLYHADLFGGLVGRLLGIPVIWSIHHSDPRQSKTFTKYISLICARLSGVLPDAIIACSSAARDTHVAVGYRENIMKVINNGIRIEKFRMKSAQREDILESLNIPIHLTIVGHVGRWSPIKDHQTFLESLGRAIAKNPDIHGVLVGTAVTWANEELKQIIENNNLVGHVTLLGERDDVARLYGCFDIFVSSSLGESFSLVLVEAISSGVLCISTNVGISKELIQGERSDIAPRDPDALYECILKYSLLPRPVRHEIAQEDRLFIGDTYSFEIMIERYCALYSAVLIEK